MDWTDEELARAEGFVGSFTAPPRRNTTREIIKALLEYLGAVHPATARERERVAAMWGFDQRSTLNDLCHKLNKAYPSLKPTTPPPLTLSTGVWRYSKTHCEWPDLVWKRDGDPKGARMLPCIACASDARALAKWLAEHGSEEEKR